MAPARLMQSTQCSAMQSHADQINAMQRQSNQCKAMQSNALNPKQCNEIKQCKINARQINQMQKQCDANQCCAMQGNVEVKVEHLPWPEMQQQLVTDISAGTAPDISHMATRWMAGFAKDGALAPIEGLMSDSFKQSFVPTFLDLQKQDGPLNTFLT